MNSHCTIEKPARESASRFYFPTDSLISARLTPSRASVGEMISHRLIKSRSLLGSLYSNTRLMHTHLLFGCLFAATTTFAQFAPEPGEPGTTAIHRDSSCF